MSTADSAQSNKNVVLQFLDEYVNRRHFAVWDARVHPDVVIHGVSANLNGSAAARHFFESILLTAFQPLTFTFEDSITEGAQVVVRLIETGTMRGTFMGMAPTGKTYTIPAVQICRLENGKLVEMWGFRDTGSQMQQLGLVPTPPRP